MRGLKFVSIYVVMIQFHFQISSYFLNGAISFPCELSGFLTIGLYIERYFMEIVSLKAQSGISVQSGKYVSPLWVLNYTYIISIYIRVVFFFNFFTGSIRIVS